ncbi:Prevent-host-death family protein [Thiomonas sp. X19]|uniref:type II toxin-antitoxin system Phd/YefM family antitoxin n=1 Tax=Thiomonas sp. X19 TaxID=1050370 RepID=UPI000B6AF6BA|nr:type II toxin-antitoxin system prevent-host-death family antitoxin [Thiomonas sp. X19]SCC93057.1 Prevent-host-death family protein [Thiomonas sp. X19]
MQSTIAVGAFKARCLKLLDEVAQSHEELILTKRGRPIAKVVPIPATHPLFGAMRGSVQHAGDLIAPIGDNWEAGAAP